MERPPQLSRFVSALKPSSSSNQGLPPKSIKIFRMDKKPQLEAMCTGVRPSEDLTLGFPEWSIRCSTMLILAGVSPKPQAY